MAGFGLDRRLRLRSPGSLGAALLGICCTTSASAQELTWALQFGTAEGDTAEALVVEKDGGFFVGGHSGAGLGGPHVGLGDGWVGRFDDRGLRLWMTQVGTAREDFVTALAGSASGGCFAVGRTEGDLGGTNAGMNDVWIRRFATDGRPLWTLQLGSSENDLPTDAVSDGVDGLFLCGWTAGDLGGPIQTVGDSDAWLAHIDGQGNQEFLIKISSSNQEAANALALDEEGGVYVAGRTIGELVAPSNGFGQAWLARFDSTGTRKWVRQFGSGVGTTASAAAVPGGGGVCIAGSTNGSLAGMSHGGSDAWAARFDDQGTLVWLRQYGSLGNEILQGLGSDLSGGLWACGVTNGDFGGPQVSGFDAWIAHLDELGRLTWIEHLGSQGLDTIHRVAAAGPTALVAAGSTEGGLVHSGAGFADVLILRYDRGAAGATYCSASTTSIPSCQASIGASGSPTLSDPAAWTVSSGPVPGANLGLLLFGSSGPDNTPYGTLGGKLCVASPTFRTAPKSGRGGPGQCNGGYAFTLADLISAAPIVTSGATIHAQVWARDPANADGFLLSDGIEVTVCP